MTFPESDASLQSANSISEDEYRVISEDEYRVISDDDAKPPLESTKSVAVTHNDQNYDNRRIYDEEIEVDPGSLRSLLSEWKAMVALTCGNLVMFDMNIGMPSFFC